MRYITREMTRAALAIMQQFHVRQLQLHRDFDIDFVINTGRRNIVMSAAQEESFARVLNEKFSDVLVDGRTGKADIYIGELDRELECKLTTPNATTGAISFNTDYETLLRKGSLDYLYVIVSADFEKFCVLHFVDLTVTDFRPPAAGARGKSAMIKCKGMQKCEALWGDVETQNDRAVERANSVLAAKMLRLNQECDDARGHLITIEAALERDVDFVTGEPLRSRRRCGMRKIRDRLKARPEWLGKKYKQDVIRIDKKIDEVQRRPPQFSFILRDLNMG
jgi:hypothetical protein